MNTIGTIEKQCLVTDRWLDEKEVARMLGTSAAVMRLSRTTGQLWKGVPAPPHFTVGESKKVLYSLIDIIQFMLRHYRSQKGSLAHQGVLPIRGIFVSHVNVEATEHSNAANDD